MTRTLSLVLMDGPYESANTTTAMRIIDAALRKGHHVHVAACEGALAYGSSGRPAERIVGLVEMARQKGLRLDWLRVIPEGREADRPQIGGPAGVRTGGPSDLWKQIETADNVLVIPSR